MRRGYKRGITSTVNLAGASPVLGKMLSKKIVTWLLLPQTRPPKAGTSRGRQFRNPSATMLLKELQEKFDTLSTPFYPTLNSSIDLYTKTTTWCPL